jgi:hypothetical protein
VSASWVLILALAAGTVLFKVTGPLLAGGRQPPAPLLRVIGLLAPALITALIVSDTFTSGQHLAIDARVVGLGVGAVALWFKVPAVVALILAAATCAVVRLIA